jgi:hypothetical protein
MMTTTIKPIITTSDLISGALLSQQDNCRLLLAAEEFVPSHGTDLLVMVLCFEPP